MPIQTINKKYKKNNKHSKIDRDIRKRTHKTRKTRKINLHINTNQTRDDFGYKVTSALDLDKLQFKKYYKIIVSLNVSVPIIGYITLDKSYKFYNRQTYFIFRNGFLIGMVFFHNLTYEFKKSILGQKFINDKSFKSNANISNYIMGWVFSQNIMNKKIFNNLIYKFRSSNGLLKSNIIILVLRSFNLTINQDDLKKLDMFYRYKPIIEYPKSDEYREFTGYGLKYNGYHVNMHNNLLHLYSLRFIEKHLSCDDFFPTYIISRQFDNPYAVELFNIKRHLESDGIIRLNNYNRYCLDNFLVYYTNHYDNGVASIYYSMPYKFQFIVNYMTNELGNSHIITNYNYLYLAISDMFGSKSKELNNLSHLIYSFDDAMDILKRESSSIIMAIYPTAAFNYEYIGFTFTNQESFVDFINNNPYNKLNGYFLKNYSFNKDLFPITTGTLYNVVPYLIFVFINNKLKCYMYDIMGFLIFAEKYEELISSKRFNFNKYSFLHYPFRFHDKFNEFASKPQDLNKIAMQMRNICTIIGKVYKKYVNLLPNQIHGFRAIHPVMRLIKDVDGNAKPILFRIDHNPNISRSKNVEMSEWIYNVAIKPAIYKDYIPGSEPENINSLAYQPLNIDD